MKGLAVATGPDAAENARRVRLMLDALVHRGGDGEAIVELDGVCLGATTKCTLPSERAAAPAARLPCGSIGLLDGRVDEADRLLQVCGAGPVVEAGDVEAAVAAMVASPEAFAERVVGEYALVVWDPRSRALLLSRDRFGLKPLYYARRGDGWLVASEVQALVRAGVPATPDRQSVAASLVEEHHEYDRTLLEGVWPVACGGLVRLEGASVEVRRCFKPERVPVDPRPDAEGRALREALTDAVRRAMRARGRVAVFLSGGLDSAVVAALARDVARSDGLPPPLLVTTRFPGLAHDEGPWSSAVARHLGLELHELVAPTEPESYRPDLLSLEYSYDPTEVLFRAMVGALEPAGVNVVLSGTGSDELQMPTGLESVEAWRTGPAAAALAVGLDEALELSRLRAFAAGFARVHAGTLLERVRPRTRRLPPWLSEEARVLLAQSRAERATALRQLRGLGEARRAWLGELLHGYACPYQTSAQSQLLARAGVELRLPFLDRGPSDYFFSRVTADRVHRRVYKPLLRAAARPLLPEAMRARPPTTFNDHFARIWGAALGELELRQLRRLHLVDPGEVESNAKRQAMSVGLHSRSAAALLGSELTLRRLSADALESTPG